MAIGCEQSTVHMAMKSLRIAKIHSNRTQLGLAISLGFIARRLDVKRNLGCGQD